LLAAFSRSRCLAQQWQGRFEDGQAAVRHGDYATAMQYFRVLADQGNAVAQNNLGFMYDQGLAGC
jgi:TPR repeat protein